VLISLVFAISGVSWGNVLLLGLLFAAYFLFLVWVASWGNVIELKSRKIRLADTSSPIQYVAYKDVRRITRHSGGGIELEYVASNRSVRKVELQPENVSDLVDELSRRYETATGRPLEMVG
jgi:hypothetical protein